MKLPPILMEKSEISIHKIFSTTGFTVGWLQHVARVRGTTVDVDGPQRL